MEDFVPDECATQISADGRMVRITFARDDGKSRVVTMPIHQLPQLVAEFQGRISPGQVTPIHPRNLHPGGTIRSSGTATRRNPDGTMTLLHTFEIAEEHRTVQLPQTLDRAAATSLRDILDRYIREEA